MAITFVAMGVVFRQSVKSSISTFVGALIGGLIIFIGPYLIPSEQELGFRETFTTYALVAAQILLFGTHNTLAVFIHKYDDRDRRKAALLSLSLVAPLILITVATLVYFLFKEPFIALFKPADIPLIRRYFSWLPLFTLFFAYQIVLETYLISQMKVAKATFLREVLLRLLNLPLIVLFGFRYISFDLLIWLTVLVYLVPVSIQWLLSRGTPAWQFSSDWSAFNKEERYEIVHFTWYHSLLSVSVTLIGFLDLIMIPSLSQEGMSAVPVYTRAVFLMSLLQIPYKAMLNATFPILAQAFAANDHPKVQDVFRRSSMNIFVASVGMWLLIACNLHNAVAILPEEYAALAPVVLILSIGRMADLSTGMNDQVLSISKHYKYNFYISLLLVVMLVGLNWYLIPRYNIYGAAWATTSALIIYNLLKFFIVRKKLGIQPFSAKTPLVLVAGAAAFAIGYLLPAFRNPFADALCRSVLIVVAYAGMLYWLKPSEDLSTYLQSIRKNKRLF